MQIESPRIVVVNPEAVSEAFRQAAEQAAAAPPEPWPKLPPAALTATRGHCCHCHCRQEEQHA